MSTPARPVLDLARLTPRELWLWLRGWEHGYLEGAATADAEHYAPIEAAARDTVRRAAARPPRDVLEERRGNPTRAATIRDQWARSGLRQGAA